MNTLKELLKNETFKKELRSAIFKGYDEDYLFYGGDVILTSSFDINISEKAILDLLTKYSTDERQD